MLYRYSMKNPVALQGGGWGRATGGGFLMAEVPGMTLFKFFKLLYQFFTLLTV